MFDKKNSARSLVGQLHDFKPRKIDLSNVHKTTMNFGDLVPAYRCYAYPGDQFKLDMNCLAKFYAMLAPAMSRMRLKSEWFYVPMKVISPPTLRYLQDYGKQILSYGGSGYGIAVDMMSSIILNSENFFARNNTVASSYPSFTAQQSKEAYGVPSIPAWSIAAFMASDTITTMPDSIGAISYLDSATPARPWRDHSGSIDFDHFGAENLVTYASKKRVSKLLSYMGLPKRLTTMRYNADVYFDDRDIPNTTPVKIFSSYSAREIPQESPLDRSRFSSFDASMLNGEYLRIIPYFDNGNGTYEPNVTGVAATNMVEGSTIFLDKDEASIVVGQPDEMPLYPGTVTPHYLLYAAFPDQKDSFNTGTGAMTFDNINSYINVAGDDPSTGFHHWLPKWTSYTDAPIVLHFFQAYQAIYNNFYRDQKLQADEIRYYPTSVGDQGKLVNYPLTDMSDSQSLTPSVIFNPYDLYAYYQRYDYINNSGSPLPDTGVFFNNLLGLRRRNRNKDVFNTCVTDLIVSLSDSSNLNPVNSFSATLQSRALTYLQKAAFTGSTWAEYLSRFWDEKAHDYLSNNVVYLGGNESTVSISENLQTSETSADSPQGNRAGIAGDFHGQKEIYFRVPDFGVIMCIVSAIPDDDFNFNGLPEDFGKVYPEFYNLPDFQNTGFQAVFNSRMDVGLFAAVQSPLVNPPARFSSIASEVFGYQPFGYADTYMPNRISGNLQDSLRFWHQSPDFDKDFVPYFDPFTSTQDTVKLFGDSLPRLNEQLPSIGYRQSPHAAELAAQYYNNIFAVTDDFSGDHILCDMHFYVEVKRKSAFFSEIQVDNHNTNV